jgi:Delta7-sterol 5-desaturase
MMMDQLKSILSPVLIGVIRYFILAGIPFLVLYVLFPYKFIYAKIQSNIATNKDFIREISYSLQTTLIFTGISLFILFTPIKGYTRFYSQINDYAIWWIPVSVLLAMIIHDTYFYWIHRAMHHPRLFKRFHLVHHRSTNPSPLASYSFHFLEGIIESLIVPILLFSLPMHRLSLILFAFVSFAINVYGHLGYEIAPRWFRKSFLFQLLNTSVHHNLHHEKSNGNYGLYFRFWDKWVGTEHAQYVTRFDQIEIRRNAEAESKN